MMVDDITTLDFETHAIRPRPDYPPRPVGIAFLTAGEPATYIAWGHPCGNGVWQLRSRGVRRVEGLDPWQYAVRRLPDFWAGTTLWHNGPFDLEVAERHLGLPMPPWERAHDTLYSLFLRDPHTPNLRLKPSAERILHMRPEEQDRLRDWVLEHVRGATEKSWGAHISQAPGDLVAWYACGDVVRTRRLHDRVYPTLDEGMRGAYDRERRLAPILLANSREGMRVDLPLLERDHRRYSAAQEHAAQWLRRRLRTPDLNIDSGEELADALERCRVVTQFAVTETGQRSVAKDTLTADKFRDPRVFRALAYYTRLGTSLGTFMRPWLEMARENHGYIYTSWNAVRGEGRGARSGRLSCTPNFQNIPKKWEGKEDGYEHPRHMRVPPLPLIRRYLLPDRGDLFAHRDYNQQELRILAHYENDKLCAAYNEDLSLDVHAYIQEQIRLITGLSLERPPVKIVNFRKVYGGGTSGLAAKLGIPYRKARQIEDALVQAIPGLRVLERELHERFRTGQPLRTWGGRLYYCEPPGYSKKFKRMMTYEYKALNYLIQPSAADTTKEAIIRYHDIRRHGRFLVTVHDEINLSVPRGALREEMGRLREAMESLGVGGSDRWGTRRFDVPMRSDPKVGPRWGDLRTYREAR